MSAPLEWALLLKGRKLNVHPGAHSDNYGDWKEEVLQYILLAKILSFN